MKLQDFLIGVVTGVAAAIVVKKVSERTAPYISSDKVLANIRQQFKEESPIDGSWIYMKPEPFQNGAISMEVYRGGVSRLDTEGRSEVFEFAADARSGAVVQLVKN